MPRPILFVQGAGDNAHDQWDNRLVDSLRSKLGDGYVIHYPRMPDEANPTYLAWKSALLQALDGLGDDAILVGHSAGGTMLLHTLTDARPKLKAAALMLIAPPFIGDGGWQVEGMTAHTTFELPAGMTALIYHGTQDDTVPAAHMQLYAKALPQANIRSLHGRDHQLNNDLSEVADDIRALSAAP